MSVRWSHLAVDLPGHHITVGDLVIFDNNRGTYLDQDTPKQQQSGPPCIGSSHRKEEIEKEKTNPTWGGLYSLPHRPSSPATALGHHFPPLPLAACDENTLPSIPSRSRCFLSSIYRLCYQFTPSGTQSLFFLGPNCRTDLVLWSIACLCVPRSGRPFGLLLHSSNPASPNLRPISPTAGRRCDNLHYT